MKTKPLKETTEAHGVRLPVSYWLKLRALMTHHGGRAWLERAIDREVKSVQKKALLNAEISARRCDGLPGYRAGTELGEK